MADKRTRNFATVVYPESAPENWKNILSEMKVPCFVSPFHNLDINPTGEVKKEHYHVLFMFEGKKSVEQVLDLIQQIGGVGCEQVNSIRAYARYLCHLDNPDKTQYLPCDVLQYGGADYLDIIGLATDRYAAIAEMIEFCEEKDIFSYSVLLRICMEQHHDWFRVLCDSGTIVMKEYLKSRRWTRDDEIDRCRD